MKWINRVAVGVMAPLIVAHSLSAQEAEMSTTFSHEDWTSVVESFVDDEGLVDYRGLASGRDDLDSYLEAIESASPTSRPELFPSRDDELAYYINAYNALVFDGVLGLGPDAKTVWGLLGTGYGFFVRMKVVLGGEKTSLKSLEDDVIRAGFQDPRIHAALNCASIGCPRLPQWAFEGDKLDEQLDAVMGEFVTTDRHCLVDPDTQTVTLSKIFDWFVQDFEDYEAAQGNSNGGLIDYVNRFRPAEGQIPESYGIEFAKYDKGLNRQAN